MKSRLLLLFICAAALSCKDGRVEKQDDGTGSRINFATKFTESPGTRGAVLEDAADLAARGGFDVWATSHTAPWESATDKGLLLQNVAVTGSVSGDDITWSYASKVTWPVGKYVSFFAYGPAASATPGAVSAAGSPTLAFSVKPNVKEQVDFTIARPVYNQQAGSYSGSQPVTLFFNHALSRIVLSAQMVNNDVERDIVVKSVKLNNLYYSGTADLGAATTTWSVDQTKMTGYTLSTAGGELNEVVLQYPVTNLTTEDGYLFLMPQTLVRTSGLAPSMDVTLDMEGEEDVIEVPISNPEEWLPGKSYNYQLVIDGYDVKLVLVSVEDLTLTDWDVAVMIQPVPLTTNERIDQRRLHSAIESLGHLNLNEDMNTPASDDCKYFSVYLMNSVTHDITIDLTGYEAVFTEGEYLIFDGRKIVGNWETDLGTGKGYVFTVNFDTRYWTLSDALQNVADPTDASTGATASATTTPAVTNSITTYGSVIVQRTATPVP